jgi:hypothetical protein
MNKDGLIRVKVNILVGETVIILVLGKKKNLRHENLGGAAATATDTPVQYRPLNALKIRFFFKF